MGSARNAPFGFEHTDSDSGVFVDWSCAQCPACTAGAPLWCSQPSSDGRSVTEQLPARCATVLTTALLAVAALAEVPAAETVLVVAAEESPLALLARSIVVARLVTATDLHSAELRAELAQVEPSGRAGVVVAGLDVREAVKAVRRGGFVCIADDTSQLPTVTELVQREVTLVGPRDVAGVLARVAHDDWEAALAAA